MKMPTLLVFLALALSACQSHTTHSSHHVAHSPTAGLSEEIRTKTLATADWSQVQTLNIELRDYGFTPRELHLKSGQTYRLIITNNGSTSHYFDAPEFLRSIASRKVMVPNHAEVKADFFNAFELSRRGGSMELFFVPVTQGRYRAHCHLDGKEHVGVEGTLVIE